MASRRRYTTYVCGGDFANLDPRGDCPNAIHDWPLPLGYVDASEMAASRLSHGWSNTKCPECGLYGWGPGQFKGLAAESIRVESEPS
jgi:hypothetical protein